MATTEAGSDRICIGAFKRRGFGLAKGHFGQTCLHVQSYVVFRVPASSTGHRATARTIVEVSFPPRDSEVEQGAFSPVARRVEPTGGSRRQRRRFSRCRQSFHPPSTLLQSQEALKGHKRRIQSHREKVDQLGPRDSSGTAIPIELFEISWIGFTTMQLNKEVRIRSGHRTRHAIMSALSPHGHGKTTSLNRFRDSQSRVRNAMSLAVSI